MKLYGTLEAQVLWSPVKQPVWSRRRVGKPGACIGTTKCLREGCLGMVLIVKWPDNELTSVCSAGLMFDTARRDWEVI